MNQFKSFFRHSLVAITVLSTASAYAVHTKKCPEQIELNLENFEGLAEEKIEDFFWNYVSTYEPQKIASFKFLSYARDVSTTLKLKSTPRSECHYEETETEDKRWFRAQIRGTHKKPYLQAFYTVELNGGVQANYIVYGSLDSYTKSDGLKLTERPNHRLYTDVEYCEWGECVTDYIQIGNVNLSIK